MNPRKLMARLNASTVRFDTGRGGIPEFTPQDIAWSLAYVRDELAREVFCAIWAPELARLARADILRHLRAEVLREFGERARAYSIAALDLHVAECETSARLQVSADDRKAVARLRDRRDVARARRWPGEPAVYAKVCAAVLTELSNGAICDECKGRGHVQYSALTKACPACAATGKEPALDVWRARCIDKLRVFTDGYGDQRNDASAYVRTWRPVYQWTFELAAAKEIVAANQVAAALSRDEAREAA